MPDQTESSLNKVSLPRTKLHPLSSHLLILKIQVLFTSFSQAHMHTS